MQTTHLGRVPILLNQEIIKYRRKTARRRQSISSGHFLSSARRYWRPGNKQIDLPDGSTKPLRPDLDLMNYSKNMPLTNRALRLRIWANSIHLGQSSSQAAFRNTPEWWAPLAFREFFVKINPYKGIDNAIARLGYKALFESQQHSNKASMTMLSFSSFFGGLD